MKKIERYNLIGQIALELQARMNTTGINIFLGGFGVEHEMVDIVPSKRVYVEKLLSKELDKTVIEIADELGIDVPVSTTATCSELKDYLKKGGYQAATHDFERALGYISSDPEQALGSASSTLESICKAILDQHDEPYPKDQSLQPLLKSVFTLMDLSPDGHADPDIKRVLGGLLNAAIGIGVLRTKYSGFHGKGKDQKRKKLTDRHSRLAVNSCTAIGLFLIETYNERFKT
ncbi:MAG: abortive infection family protein [Deltaproteobacteria bacterium]|nr:abortive infection family protein [Deltaproteobacteria bacterium]